MSTPQRTLIDLLDRNFYGDKIASWLAALAVGLGVVVAMMIVRWVAVRWFTRRTGAGTRELTLARDLGKGTHRFFTLALALEAGTRMVTLRPKVDHWLDKFVIVAFVVQVGLWGNDLTTYFVERSLARRGVDSKTSFNALNLIAKIVLWVMMLLILLTNLGINVSALLTGLGIGGVAVALSLQNILGDLFSSLSILVDKPFEIGDSIGIDTLSGTVQKIGLKTTRIRSDSGEELIIANADLLKARIKNFQRMQERRGKLTLSISYQTPVEKVATVPALIRQVVEGENQARVDHVHLMDLAQSGFSFELIWWSRTATYAIYLDLQQRIQLGILERLAKEGVLLAYPSQSLYLTDVTPRAEVVTRPASSP